MASDFLLPLYQLNFFLLSKEKKREVMDNTELIVTEAVELFEYRKLNEDY